MATRAENIEARLDAIAAELAAMGSCAAGGKPNSSGSNAVDHVGYRMSLINEAKELEALLSSAEGSYEINSQIRGL